MTRYIAFLRAINVGGHAVVKMTDLRDGFSRSGCREVRTYIQSGNVVFESAVGEKTLERRVRSALGRMLGGNPDLMLRTSAELEALVARAPFAPFEKEPGIKLYVAFLLRPPTIPPAFPLVAPAEALEAFALHGREAFIVSRRKKNGFYGFPNTFIEKALGVPATSRNWSTVTKLVTFARGHA